MSSNFDLQSIVELLQLYNYTANILIAGVSYDYLLVLPREIEYIWCRRWSWVSTLFVLIRYCGLCWVIAAGILNSVSFSGSVMTLKDGHSKGTVLGQVSTWSFELFNGAADLVMVLRVYAMWNRSKIILCVLLFIYVPRVIIAIVFTGIYDSASSVSTVQVLSVSVCNFSYNLPAPIWLYLIPHAVLSVTLVILAVMQTLKQSLDMYIATKKWQPNQYMKLLAREGIAYFLVRLLYDVVDTIDRTLPQDQVNTPMLFVRTLVTIPLFSMLPRFIVGMREMYARDLSSHWQGLDTGFGVFSTPLSHGSTTLFSLGFADIPPQQGQFVEGNVDGSESIELGMVGYAR